MTTQPQPVDLPEVTDEMVERARIRTMIDSIHTFGELRSFAVNVRHALLAAIPQWQPIERDQIKAGMRIRETTVAWSDRTVTCSGVAHHTDKDGDWFTESGLRITGSRGSLGISVTHEVDSATIPDPDADLVKELARLLDLTDAEDARKVIATVREHDGKVGL